MFWRLSVVAGGCELEAVEAVVAGICPGRCEHIDIEAGAVPDLLAQLVDKSLVTVDGSGRAAWNRLLEPVGPYGPQRLAEDGGTETTQGRHAGARRPSAGGVAGSARPRA